MIALVRWARTYGAYVVVGLVTVGWISLAWPFVGDGGARAASLRQVASADSGRAIYLQSCAACHGQQGQGTVDGPSLQSSGAAAADFMLRTGRMPLNRP